MSSTKFWEIFVQFAQKKMLDKILGVWYNVEFGARTAKGSRARADKKKGFRPSPIISFFIEGVNYFFKSS
jgi:hypothetical protein